MCQTAIKEAHFYRHSAWMTVFIGISYKFEQNDAVDLEPKAMFFSGSCSA
jgi:hypothetical protein